MKYVLDASVALKWELPEDDSALGHFLTSSAIERFSVELGVGDKPVIFLAANQHHLSQQR